MAVRRANLQTARTVRADSAPAMSRWGAIRQSPEVSKARASQSWMEIVRAIKEGDARLTDANDELAKRKATLAALEAQLADWNFESPHP